MSAKKRVAIIGGGAAGLTSARHVSANKGFECVVFEMRVELGGTWAYTSDVEVDEYGYPVYSAMYQGLRTNLPKEMMGFPDFPIVDDEKSYLTQAEIQVYLKEYATRFQLEPLIKFNSFVTDIHPLDDNTWQLTYVCKETNTVISQIYDAVMICNGHYNDPVVPEIRGLDMFRGRMTHSRIFRSPEPYRGKRVLVIGAGPSGLDVTLQMSQVAEHVVLSHNCAEANDTMFPDNVEKKPLVKRIHTSDKVEFVDGSCCDIDAIIFCTGYKYSFPFLDESCGVTVDNNFVQPLYKHMVHIEKPSMCFIGIPFSVCPFQAFDLQARYFCASLNGSMQLPSTEDMRTHTDRDMQNRWARGYTRHQAHMMDEDQQSYYNSLAEEARTTTIEPVLVELKKLSVRRLYEDLLNFRRDRYKIVNNTIVRESE